MLFSDPVATAPGTDLLQVHHLTFESKAVVEFNSYPFQPILSELPVAGAGLVLKLPVPSAGNTFLHLSASYIVRSMRAFRLMEDLLAIEAETKFLLAANDRSYEQTLMQELLRIFKEAELLFGPRDASYQLSVPRITECATSRTYIFAPLRMTRIYLSRDSRTKPWLASLELAHESIHVLSPFGFGTAPTILEEGLAEWFAQRYVNRVHGLSFERGSNPKADAVMDAVSTLLAKNVSVIKDLRTRQPVISKIDEKLLVAVAGLELSQAKFLCTDFRSYWRTSNGFAAQGAERLAACLRSLWN